MSEPDPDQSADQANRRAARVNEIVAELRDLICAAAPEPALAAPVHDCGPDEVLDQRLPFSSVIILGVIVAIEDRYGITIQRASLERAVRGGATLHKLATLVAELGG